MCYHHKYRERKTIKDILLVQLSNINYSGQFSTYTFENNHKYTYIYHICVHVYMYLSVVGIHTCFYQHRCPCIVGVVIRGKDGRTVSSDVIT